MRTHEDDLVISPDVAEVMAAIEATDLEAPWEEAAPRLRLALPRRRPLPPGTDDLPTQIYPPGIRAVLGLDIGPAMVFVIHEQLQHWGVSADHAFRRALANVRDRLKGRHRFACAHQVLCGESVTSFQSREGWASMLLLMPEQLATVLGAQEGLVFAPMRDLVMRLPPDADPLLAHLIIEEFAEADWNALDLPLFRLADGKLSIAEGEAHLMRLH